MTLAIIAVGVSHCPTAYRPALLDTAGDIVRTWVLFIHGWEGAEDANDAYLAARVSRVMLRLILGSRYGDEH